MPRTREPEGGALDRRPGPMPWQERIRRALVEGRFQLWSQEIRGLANGATPGHCAEVLLRLEEDGRLLSPAVFVPAAEAHHLMPALDRWVIEAALGRLAERPEASTHLSINLSGQSLADGRLLDHVLGVLAATGVETSRLCFEITETAAIADMAEAALLMRALRERGCRFALDDFGSGLASFSYLKRLPFDLLKIDGGFVRQMTRDPTDRVLVEAMHRMGHRLGMRTVAESVEDEATLEALREMGVEFAQGYAVAPPRPLEGA